jgi:RecB family exonuclease
MSQTIPVYSPSKLGLFGRCPYAYWRTYIDRSMPRLPATPAQARGQVVHTILSRALSRFAGGAPLPETVRADAEDLMSAYDHLDPAQIAADTVLAEQLAEFALDHVDVAAHPLLVERQASYIWRTKSGSPFARLTARIDVVFQREDGIYEIIDWKTGDSTYQDVIQNLLLVVTGLEYLRRRYGATPDTIRLTLAHLGARQFTPVDISRAALGITWAHVGELIRRIQAERDWKATANNLCEYCPLFQNSCPLEGPDYLEMRSDEDER